jgi:hypothetical protein
LQRARRATLALPRWCKKSDDLDKREEALIAASEAFPEGDPGDLDELAAALDPDAGHNGAPA